MESKRSIATLRLCIGVSATERHVCDFWSVLLALMLLLPENVVLFPLRKLAEARHIGAIFQGSPLQALAAKGRHRPGQKATETGKDIMVARGVSGCGVRISVLWLLIRWSSRWSSTLTQTCATCGVGKRACVGLSAPGVRVGVKLNTEGATISADFVTPRHATHRLESLASPHIIILNFVRFNNIFHVDKKSTIASRLLMRYWADFITTYSPAVFVCHWNLCWWGPYCEVIRGDH
jgi:hypothetical protein